VSGRTFVATVPESLSGVRIDRAVALLTGVSRSTAAALVAGGQVLLDGGPVASRSRPLAAGAVLSVELPEPVAIVPDRSVAFSVVFEDEALVIVDKPPGVIVHPGAGRRDGTLVAGLLARYPDLAEVGDPTRPGVVHRLDRGTSGLLAVARTPEAHAALGAQLRARTAGRRYVALVTGHVASDRGVVDAPIGRSDRMPTRMAVSVTGRPARTTYEVLRRLDVLMGEQGAVEAPATLLACSLETGRTHQIRVHLSAIGHPVVGDDRYGGTTRRILRPGRVFLHAAELSLDHPVSGERMSWTSELPTDLRLVLGRD